MGNYIIELSILDYLRDISVVGVYCEGVCLDLFVL